VKLFHVTGQRNRRSIGKSGLDPQRSQGREQAVWLVSRSLVAWALAHTAAKPGRGTVQQLVVYECQISRAQLRRYRRGIWRCYRTVRPSGWAPNSEYTQAYP
jgi:hypothetical protein